MITRQAEEAQRATRQEALRILAHNPYISKKALETSIRDRIGAASSGTVSRVYNKHRRQL